MSLYYVVTTKQNGPARTQDLSRCFRTYAEAQKKMHELWRKGQEDAFIRIKFINREGGIASKRPMPPPPRNHN